MPPAATWRSWRCEARLVDKLAPRDEVRRRLIESRRRAGRRQDVPPGRTTGRTSPRRAADRNRGGLRGDAVAVVVAKGDILDGQQPAGTIGGDSTSRLIRRAREDDVGEGRRPARRQPRRQRLRLRGHPPRVRADARRRQARRRVDGQRRRVRAATGSRPPPTRSGPQPETITGSIGIFGVFPTVDKPLAKYLGVHTDGVGTTRFTDALRPDRAARPRGRRRDPAVHRPRLRGVPRPRGRGAEDDAATRWTGSRAAASGAARTRRASASSTSSAASTRRSTRPRSARSCPPATGSSTSRRRRASGSGVADMLLTRAEAADELAPDAAALGPRRLLGHRDAPRRAGGHRAPVAVERPAGDLRALPLRGGLRQRRG